jgi:NAD(P)-dependent dehydrogenase (short-subunit alcohol dehydrogenase family)
VNEVALVTGASRRIGAAIAHRLAAEGISVGLHTSVAGQQDAEGQAEHIRSAGGRAIVLACDLVDLDAAALLFSAAERAFGPVTLLVNNASLFEPDVAESFSPATFDRHIAVNVRAPLLLGQEMRRRLPADCKGAIVNMIDQRVLRPNPLCFTYAVSKAALWSATVTMAQAFAPQIRVNAIGPGPVLPNAYEGPDKFAAESAALPLRRAPSIEDVCEAVLYLAKAGSVTGQMIAVDGGQHIAWETPDLRPLF